MSADDPAEVLRAGLGEDEAAAAAAVHAAFRHWHAEPWYDGEFLPDRRTQRSDLWGDTGHQITGQGAIDTLAAEHIARHDPARVLREVEAGRRILARYEDCLVRMEDPEYSAVIARDQAREYEDFVLPALAAVYGREMPW